MNRYLDLSLEEIHSLLVDKKITPVDLVKESLARIEENKDLNAFITINDKAVEEASNLGEVDKDNLFFGIPIAITGIPSVSLLISDLLFPTPAPGTIPVSES